MQRQELLNLRLQSQGLWAAEFQTPGDVVGWMGAVQAQHLPMSKWGVGTRLPGSTNSLIDQALNNGDIIRTHILRPTWHLVRAEDLLWMQRLTAPNVQRLLNSSSKALGITAKELIKAEKILQKLLEQTQAASLKRDDLIAGLQARNILTEGQRGACFLMQAELSTLICSAAPGTSESTYALIEKRLGSRWKKAVTFAQGLSKEEALVRLARLYFQSRGPASLQDFKWWSGLNLSDARLGLLGMEPELEKVAIGTGQGIAPYYYLRPAVTLPQNAALYQFLPAFDEYLISYQDRTAAIDSIHHPKAFTKNGIFSPVLLFKGQVIGVWEKKVSKNGLIITVHPFETVADRLRSSALKALRSYGHFMGMPIHELLIKGK